MSTPTNLIEEHLGPAYANLDEVLKRAHTGAIKLTGNVSVTRGNVIARWLCDLLRLPPSAASVQLTVNGQHFPDQMLWDRDFGGIKMRSRFFKEGAALAEQFGPLKLWMKLTVDNGSLRYTLIKTTILGMTLPARWAPRVMAFEAQAADFYQFGVEVSLPIIGKLITYGGMLSLIGTEVIYTSPQPAAIPKPNASASSTPPAPNINKG